MEDDSTEYTRVFGVRFRNPVDSKYNESSVVDDGVYLFIIAAGIFPQAGLLVAVLGMVAGLWNRYKNPYRIDEMLWRAGVYSLLLQICSLVVVFVLL